MNSLRRSKMELQQAWTEMLSSDEGKQVLWDIFRDVTKKRKEIVDRVPCPRCKQWKNLEIEVEKYSAREILGLYEFLAKYGVGKPAEEKEVTVDITARTLSELREASDEELAAIVEGEYAEVLEFPSPQPEFPPAA